eukprot:TRINITY_DN17583_c0_g1_i1.p1 TRINITY_DN17583_c0_g1~~TRINITY_DN17583_c0_g1_i1.p1  ORF type:complete len:118 (-),score=25.88 TRINITY_DN17583_c0_g1_i1:140-493(-)
MEGESRVVRDDDALHEFFVMCCISANLELIDRGRLAVPRRVTEELYREAKRAEVPLHKWYAWVTVEMERHALRLEDLEHYDGNCQPPELDIEISGAIKDGNVSFTQEFARFHDCHPQ